MKPYRAANIVNQPYVAWKVITLAWAAKLLGVQFHIQGIPFGSKKSAYIHMYDEYVLGGGGPTRDREAAKAGKALSER